MVHPAASRPPVNSPVPPLGLGGIISCLLPSAGLPPITGTAAAGQVSESSTSAVTTSQQTTAPPIKTQVHSPATGPTGSPQPKGPSFLASLSLSAAQVCPVPSGHRASAHAIPIPATTLGLWSAPIMHSHCAQPSVQVGLSDSCLCLLANCVVTHRGQSHGKQAYLYLGTGPSPGRCHTTAL